MCCGDKHHHSCGISHTKSTGLFEEETKDLEEYREMLEMELKRLSAKIEKRKKKEANA